MSNVFKKVFSIGVVATNILWTIGVAAFVPSAVQAATCPTFNAGDMVKVQGQSAIYAIDSNGKALYFPTGDEFKSWNANESYGGYTTITQDCYNTQLLTAVPKTAPFGVNFRPGSYLVKRASSAQLFVVEPNNKLAMITDAAAKALYGTTSAKTVADVFFVNYDTSAPQVTEAVAHPGMLVSNGGNTYYVNANNTLSLVTAAGFTANRFKQAFVHAVPSSAIAGLTAGAQINALVPALADRSQTGGVNNAPTNNPTNGGAVSVSLAADTPASMAIPQKATGVVFTKFNVTAPAATTLNEVIVHRTGLGSSNDFSAVYLYQGSQRLTSGRTISSDTNEVIFSNVNVSLNAGQTTELSVVADLNPNLTLTGNADGFEVLGANGAAISGVSGNVMTIGSTSVASVAITALSASGNPTLGASQQEVARFNVDASSAVNNVNVNHITLTNIGSLSYTNLSNLNLVTAGKTVASAASINSKGQLVFTLATPYSVTKGNQQTFYVYADITGGRVNDTVQFYVDQTSDVGVTDTQVNANAQVTNNLTTGTVYTVTGGTLTLASNGPLAGSVSSNSTNNVLQKFSFSAGNAITVRNTKVAIYITTSNGTVVSATSTYDLVKNVKIVDLDNNNQTVVGPLSNFGTGTTATTSGFMYNFTDTFDIKAGQTRHLAVLADLDQNFPSGDMITSKVDFSGATAVQYQDNTQYVHNTDIVPNTLTGSPQQVTSAGLTVTAGNNVGSSNYVPGTTAKALAVLLSASGANDVKVDSMKVLVYAAASTSFSGTGTALNNNAQGVNANTAVTTVQLTDPANSNAAVGMTQNLSNSNGGNATTGGYYYVTFTNMNYVVKAGQTQELDVNVAFPTTVTNNTKVLIDVDPSAMVLETTSGTQITPSNVSSINNASTPVQQTVNTGGTVTVTYAPASVPQSDVVVDGVANQVFAAYNLKATNGDATVTGLSVVDAGTDQGKLVKNVYLSWTVNGATQTVSGKMVGNTTTWSNSGTHLSIPLPSNSTVLVTVSADLNTLAAGIGSAGQTVKLGLAKASGQFSGSGNLDHTFTFTSGNQTFYGDSTQPSGASNITLADASVPAFTVAQTKVTVAPLLDTASHTALRTQDEVGGFTFSSKSDTGSQQSLLKTLTLNLSGSLFTSNTTTATVSVYSDPSFNSAYLLGSATGVTANSSFSVNVNTSTQYNAVSDGSNKTLYVVAATNAAPFNPTLNGTNQYSIQAQLTGFTWDDGSVTTATAQTGLPVNGQSYSYK